MKSRSRDPLPALTLEADRAFQALRRQWMRDKIPLQAAAIAFFATFSIPALLLLVLSIAGLFLDRTAVETVLFQHIGTLIDPRLASLLESSMEAAWQLRNDPLPLLVGIVSFSAGALGFFLTLQSALDAILDIPKPRIRGWRSFLRSYIVSFVLVLLCSAILILSVLATNIFAYLGLGFQRMMSLSHELLSAADLLGSFAVIFLLFLFAYLFLPSGRVSPMPAIWGSLIATAFFAVGKYALSLYIVFTNLGYQYGTSASVLVLLVWIYFSTLVFLLGAECVELLMKPSTSR